MSSATSIRTNLNEIPWGTVTLQPGNIRQLVCPLCMAIIPAVFDNAHELPSTVTPKSMHINYHANTADMCKK